MAEIEAVTVESVIELTTIGPTVTTVFGKINRLITTTQTVNEFEVLLNFEPFIEDGAEIILNGNPVRAGGGRLFLSLERGQVSKCVDAFAAAGIEVRDDYWGMPVRAVRDADGNDLLFFDDDLAS